MLGKEEFKSVKAPVALMGEALYCNPNIPVQKVPQLSSLNAQTCIAVGLVDSTNPANCGIAHFDTPYHVKNTIIDLANQLILNGAKAKNIQATLAGGTSGAEYLFFTWLGVFHDEQGRRINPISSNQRIGGQIKEELNKLGITQITHNKYSYFTFCCVNQFDMAIDRRSGNVTITASTRHSSQEIALNVFKLDKKGNSEANRYEDYHRRISIGPDTVVPSEITQLRYNKYKMS